MRKQEQERVRENAWITLRKKKHPEPPLSHILAYPMVANMAGSGVRERVRVSAVRVRGKRRACAITGGLPCRRTRRSSMSEYRPGVTSPHTLPQRALPCPRTLSTATYPISPRSSLGLPLFALFCHPSPPLLLLRALEHSYYLAAYLQRGAPPPSSPPPPSPSVYPLDFSLSRPPLLSTSSPSLIIPVLPVRVVLLTLCPRLFPLIVHLCGRRFLTLRYSRFPTKCPLLSPQVFF